MQYLKLPGDVYRKFLFKMSCVFFMRCIYIFLLSLYAECKYGTYAHNISNSLTNLFVKFIKFSIKFCYRFVIFISFGFHISGILYWAFDDEHCPVSMYV